MKQKYFTFRFEGVNYDLTYETDGESKTETEIRIRGVLERRLADLRMEKTVSLVQGD